MITHSKSFYVTCEENDSELNLASGKEWKQACEIEEGNRNVGESDSH